jgi:hypothetical protein
MVQITSYQLSIVSAHGTLKMNSAYKSNYLRIFKYEEMMTNEELHNLYSESNVIRVSKSKLTRWVGHIACMRDIKNQYKLSVRNLMRICYFRDLSMHGG